MTIVNTAQAEQWNTGDGVAHWVDNQARYDRMHAPFTAMIIEAADLRPGTDVLDVGCRPRQQDRAGPDGRRSHRSPVVPGRPAPSGV